LEADVYSAALDSRVASGALLLQNQWIYILFGDN
jgi:hypothetical protein